VVLMGNERPLWAWLHLSDIHFGHGSDPYQADQKDLTTYIPSDVTEVLASGEVPAPVAILLTGDVGTTGGAMPGSGDKEYPAAEDFIAKLEEALTSKLTVFVVPGNHDVQRTPPTDKNAFDLLKELRDPKQTTSLDKAIKDADNAKILKDRFTDYTEFCKRIASPIGLGADGLWVKKQNVGKTLDLHLIGLNTALLSNDDFDNGVLNLPHATTTEAFQNIQKSDLVFVLTHHPTDWLNPRDLVHLTQKIRRSRSVHFHGHIHAPEIKQTIYGTGESVITVAAGAVHADEFESKTGTPHTYSFGALVELDDGSVVIRIWPRRWVAARGGWVLDSDQLPHAATYVQYVLRPPPIVEPDVIDFILGQIKDLRKAFLKRNKDGGAEIVVPIRSSAYLDAEPRQVAPDFELMEQHDTDLINLSNELSSLVEGEDDPDLSSAHVADVSGQLRLLLEGIYQQRLTFDGEKRDATGSAVTADEVFGELSGMPMAMQIHVSPGAIGSVDQKLNTVIPDASTNASDEYIG
jgi:predicted MPP superfamily phosphohydrolase